MGYVDLTFILRRSEGMRHEGKSEEEISLWAENTAKGMREAPEQTGPHDFGKFSADFFHNEQTTKDQKQQKFKEGLELQVIKLMEEQGYSRKEALLLIKEVLEDNEIIHKSPNSKE